MNDNKSKNKIVNGLINTAVVVVGGVATAVILGLAAKGLGSYLKDMNDTVRVAASIIGVALLAYAVSALVVRFAKYFSK